jgi:hypothetical protein
MASSLAAMFDQVKSDPATARAFLAQPATTLAQFGVSLEGVTDAALSQKLAQHAPNALNALAKGAEGGFGVESVVSWDCVFCQVALAVLAAMGFTLTLTALPVIGPETAAVAWLVSQTGWDVTLAITVVKAITDAMGAGATAGGTLDMTLICSMEGVNLC